MQMYVSIRRLGPLLAAAVLALTATATMADTRCPAHYPAGQAPQILSGALAQKAREICYSEFGLMHSGVARTPLWSAEHLTRDELPRARAVKRKSAFHADPHLSDAEQAELEDYARSGFDRGHMAPAGNMPTVRAQYESFSLANMVPQNPRTNQRVWEAIESAVRRFVERRGELYIITGPLFLSPELQRVGGRVLVPTHVFKLVYDPSQNRAAVYLAENVGRDAYSVVSVAELERLARIDFLPWMAPSAKQQLLALPAPSGRRFRRTPHG